jgi:hypothetical protein
VTNLDVVELLLEKGADSNPRDHLGKPPLIFTTPLAPLIVERASFLARVRDTIDRERDFLVIKKKRRRRVIMR